MSQVPEENPGMAAAAENSEIHPINNQAPLYCYDIQTQQYRRMDTGAPNDQWKTFNSPPMMDNNFLPTFYPAHLHGQTSTSHQSYGGLPVTDVMLAYQPTSSSILASPYPNIFYHGPFYANVQKSCPSFFGNNPGPQVTTSSSLAHTERKVRQSNQENCLNEPQAIPNFSFAYKSLEAASLASNSDIITISDDHSLADETATSHFDRRKKENNQPKLKKVSSLPKRGSRKRSQRNTTSVSFPKKDSCEALFKASLKPNNIVKITARTGKSQKWTKLATVAKQKNRTERTPAAPKKSKTNKVGSTTENMDTQKVKGDPIIIVDDSKKLPFYFQPVTVKSSPTRESEISDTKNATNSTTNDASTGGNSSANPTTANNVTSDTTTNASTSTDATTSDVTVANCSDAVVPNWNVGDFIIPLRSSTPLLEVEKKSIQDDHQEKHGNRGDLGTSSNVKSFLNPSSDLILFPPEIFHLTNDDYEVLTDDDESTLIADEPEITVISAQNKENHQPFCSSFEEDLKLFLAGKEPVRRRKQKL